VKIGNRVTIKNGAMLWKGVTIEDDVFIGPGVCFTNAKKPLSGRQASVLSETNVKKGAVIGANATILSDLEIGESAFVAAGAVVTKTIPNGGAVKGNPSKDI
jgi:acetyltransferase-like isoleucine patch superfamily enzyme